MHDQTVLNYLSKSWHLFPVKCLHMTSETDAIVLNPQESVYIHSMHRVTNPEPRLVEVNSLCFRLYEFRSITVNSPVGYAFIPVLPPDYMLRVTPYSITATHSDVDIESLEKSDRKILLQTKNFEMLWLSCGVEIISDLWKRMGVFPLGE